MRRARRAAISRSVAPDAQLREYLATYRRSVVRLEYADVPLLQDPPFATLAEGAAGTAYALWRLGERRRASVWMNAALGDRRAAALGASVPPSFRRGSVMFGRVGLRWVAALLSGSQSVDDYVRSVRVEKGRLEFAAGAAGHLVGLSRLYRQKPGRTLERAAVAVQDRIARAAKRRAQWPWRAQDATGFAHGWPGVLYALLDWHQVQATPAPSWLTDALHRLAAHWRSDLVSDGFAASWCRGAAGATLLWIKAFEVTGASMFLEAARRAGAAALVTSGHSLSLCCGDAGIAYAALGMARIDTTRDWRGLATALAARTVQNTATVAMHRPCGLFQGHAGLVCLALDCLDEPRGFPLVEG